jgi:hypothetical protein
VAFGLSRLVRDLALIGGNRGYLILVGVIVLDGILLYRFFAVHREDEPPGVPGRYSAAEAARSDT